MSEIFNGVMRAISSLLGLVLVVGGVIWILQAFNLAFRVGAMVGDKQWAVYGAILAVIGVCQMIWTNTRERYYLKKQL